MFEPKILHRSSGFSFSIIKYLINFQVLYAVMKGGGGGDIAGLTMPVDEDFDPNIHFDNLGPKTAPTSTLDIKLWAQTVSNIITRVNLVKILKEKLL